MKNIKMYAINIKPVINVFNPATCEYDVRRSYIATVRGNRLDVEDGTWYLWLDSHLVTSGNTRDLHGVLNYHKSDMSMPWDSIKLDYTPVYDI